METNSDTLEALKYYYGFDGFLDNQEEVVEEILSGRDLCVIMPTGAGKSLCYQLPILMRPGYGIVVSPLISLMKDQVDSLLEKNIPAAFINSTIPFSEQARAADAAARGEIKLLYVAPERFHTDFFRSFLSAVKADGKAAVITPEVNEVVVKSARNLPGVTTAPAKLINVYDLLNAKTLVIDKEALAVIEEVFA